MEKTSESNIAMDNQLSVQMYIGIDEFMQRLQAADWVRMYSDWEPEKIACILSYKDNDGVSIVTESQATYKFFKGDNSKIPFQYDDDGRRTYRVCFAFEIASGTYTNRYIQLTGTVNL